ncbi:MAG: ABC transporter permease [Jatrophihabitans sp.]|nr:MAG: ABC transporter permease [Jatrophihabitans sp.]
MPVWLNDPANWTGPNGLLERIGQHLGYSVSAVVVALLIALPLGLVIGHTGRGVFLVVGLANGLRAVPILGLLLLLVVWLSPHLHARLTVPGLIPPGGFAYIVPIEIALVLLAIPPILSNTYAGVQAVDPAVRDAGEGMGMRGSQVIWQVEFPCALPLVMSGLRSATLQVIATATVAAYVPFLGGLGRFILDGQDQLTNLRYGYPAMVSAGIVVAVLAVVVDLLLALVQRLVVSRGVAERYRRRRGVRAVPEPA